jgi:predicted nucleic acid-binding protein
MSGIVVSDSTAIIHLSRIHALDILKNLYGQIHLPQAVHREISRGNQPGALQIANLPWIKVSAVTDRSLVEMLGANLDIGESEAIALAVEQSASLLVIDERKGRKAAAERGIAIIGIAGILLKAKQAALISKVRPHLDELARTGFHLSDEVRKEVLRLAGELDSAKRA